MHAIIFLMLLFSPARAAGARPTPEDADRHMVYGKIAFKQAQSAQDFKEAAEEFKQATAAAPWWPAPYFNMGLALERVGDADGARVAYRKYLELAPDAKDAVDVKHKLYELEFMAKKKAKALDAWKGKWELPNAEWTDNADCGSQSGTSVGHDNVALDLAPGEDGSWIANLRTFSSSSEELILRGKPTADGLDLSADGKPTFKEDKRTEVTYEPARLLLSQGADGPRARFTFSYRWVNHKPLGSPCRLHFIYDYDGPAKRAIP